MNLSAEKKLMDLREQTCAWQGGGGGSGIE